MHKIRGAKAYLKIVPEIEICEYSARLEAKQKLRAYSSRIWSSELWTRAPEVPELSVKLILSHVGGPSECPVDGYEIKFDIDEPSSLEKTSAKTDSKGEARLSGNYRRRGQEPILVEAWYPSKVWVFSDGTRHIEGTAKVQRVLLPICYGGAETVNKGDLFFDMLYSDEELAQQFLDVLKGYKGNLVDTSGDDSPVDLLYYMATTDDSQPQSLLDKMRTGKEAELEKRIIEQRQSSGKKLTPGGVFSIALEMFDGDAYRAVKACYNLLEGKGRGWEVSKEEYNDLQLKIDEIKNKYKQGKMNSKEAGNKLAEVKRKSADHKFFEENLVLLRDYDNIGGWYHLFGTMATSMNSQGHGLTMPGYYVPKGLLKFFTSDWDELGKYLGIVAARETAGRLMNAYRWTWFVAWLEERHVSGDLYSDPSEFCIDLTGNYIGASISDYIHGKKGVLKRAWGWIRGWGTGLLQVKSPVSVKITDSSGKSFVFDREGGTYRGDLDVLFYPFMEEDGTYGVLMSLPEG
jgi:hypothetical protein